MAENKFTQAINSITAIIKSFKGEGEIPPVQPAAPVAPVIVQLQDVTLKDGSMISVDKLEVGGLVTIAGVTAAAGDYEVNDGSIIKVGDAGVITEIVPIPVIDPAQVPPAQMAQPAVPPVIAQPAPVSMEQIQKFAEQFATGTPEERITNIEAICRDLMEYNFGWQLREAQQKAVTDQAIAVYKNGFDKQVEENTTLKTDFATAKDTIQKQGEAIEQMLGLIQQLGDVAAADPIEPAKLSFAQEQVKDREQKRLDLAERTKAYIEQNKK